MTTDDQPQAETSAKQTGDIIYAWQMQVDDGWNLIAMLMPNGQSMPLITTTLGVAWEAFEVAQAHANRHQCQCRLATFRFDGVTAIVDPNDE